jgi:hypothetical protein
MKLRIILVFWGQKSFNSIGSRYWVNSLIKSVIAINHIQIEFFFFFFFDFVKKMNFKPLHALKKSRTAHTYVISQLRIMKP